MTKNKKLGLLFLLGPIALLIAVIILWSIASFVLSVQNPEIINQPDIVTESGPMFAVINIINLVLSFLGLIAVILIFPGVIIGIVFLLQKEKQEQPKVNNNNLK